MLNTIAAMIQNNPTGTLRDAVLLVAGFYLLLGITKLARPAAGSRRLDLE